MTTAISNPLSAWPVSPMAKALRRLDEATHSVDSVRGAFRRLVDTTIAPSIADDAPAASVELLGTISRFVVAAELDLEQMTRQVQELAKVRDCIGLELNDQEVEDAR